MIIQGLKYWNSIACRYNTCDTNYHILKQYANKWRTKYLLSTLSIIMNRHFNPSHTNLIKYPIQKSSSIKQNNRFRHFSRSKCLKENIKSNPSSDIKDSWMTNTRYDTRTSTSIQINNLIWPYSKCWPLSFLTSIKKTLFHSFIYSITLSII